MRTLVRHLPRSAQHGDVVYASIVDVDGKAYTLSTLWRGQGRAFGTYTKPEGNPDQLDKALEDLYKNVGQDPEIARNCETALFADHSDVIERHGFVWSEDEARGLHMKTLEKFLQGAYENFVRELSES